MGGELISIRLKFLFEDKDQTKALKLHKLLQKYGVVDKIVHSFKDESLNKNDRLAGILNVMDVGKTYTTGRLWERYKSHTSEKTFQRDLNTLIIRGEIIGVKDRSKGSTTLWTRRGWNNDEQGTVAKINTRQNGLLVEEC
jgi:hypothetical protein